MSVGGHFFDGLLIVGIVVNVSKNDSVCNGMG